MLLPELSVLGNLSSLHDASPHSYKPVQIRTKQSWLESHQQPISGSTIAGATVPCTTNAQKYQNGWMCNDNYMNNGVGVCVNCDGGAYCDCAVSICPTLAVVVELCWGSICL